jgi:hypothetical protein
MKFLQAPPRYKNRAAACDGTDAPFSLKNNADPPFP